MVEPDVDAAAPGAAGADGRASGGGARSARAAGEAAEGRRCCSCFRHSLNGRQCSRGWRSQQPIGGEEAKQERTDNSNARKGQTERLLDAVSPFYRDTLIKWAGEKALVIGFAPDNCDIFVIRCTEADGAGEMHRLQYSAVR